MLDRSGERVLEDEETSCVDNDSKLALIMSLTHVTNDSSSASHI